MTATPSEIVELRAGPAVLEVSPAACGAVTRFAWELDGDALEWLRPATPFAVARRFPQDMACFPLVPFSNRIRDGRFTFRGRDVELPKNFPPEPHAIHGHGWRAAWEVLERAAASLTIEYRHAADAWPWTYRARQRFALTAERLEVEVSITNNAADPMPAGFGLHPYLVRTPGARLRVDVGQMWVADDASMPRELVAPPPDLVSSGAGLNPSDLALDNNFLGFGGRAVAEWPEWHARLRIETAGPFACFVVFTPAGEDYFCAEPVTNCIDAFNLAFDGRSDTGMLVVDPGQTVSGTVAFLPETGVTAR